MLVKPKGNQFLVGSPDPGRNVHGDLESTLTVNRDALQIAEHDVDDGKNLFGDTGEDLLPDGGCFCITKGIERRDHALADEGVGTAKVHAEDIRSNPPRDHHDGGDFGEDILELDALGADEFDCGMTTEELVLNPQLGHLCGSGGSGIWQAGDAEADLGGRRGFG